jgi:F420H(2)-dependent quinone reductase
MFMNRSTEEVTMSTISLSNASPAAAHYKRPDWFTTHVFNKAVAGLTRLGVSVLGSRVLEHRGRSSGELHHTPVNLLTLEGTQYLVAPRGETQWVRNVRHSGGHMVLIQGRRRQICQATEIPPADAVPILRAYLRRWKFETGQFFDGITPDATDEEWSVAAPKHPVFEIG